MKNPIQFANASDAARGTLGGSRSRHAVRLLLLAGFSLITLGVSSTARAVCQDGCDLGTSNTFLGDDALVNNTTGIFNTAIVFEALFSNTTGNFNTAIGVLALVSNTTGSNNTANGF